MYNVVLGANEMRLAKTVRNKCRIIIGTIYFPDSKRD